MAVTRPPTFYTSLQRNLVFTPISPAQTDENGNPGCKQKGSQSKQSYITVDKNHNNNGSKTLTGEMRHDSCRHNNQNVQFFDRNRSGSYSEGMGHKTALCHANDKLCQRCQHTNIYGTASRHKHRKSDKCSNNTTPTEPAIDTNFACLQNSQREKSNSTSCVCNQNAAVPNNNVIPQQEVSARSHSSRVLDTGPQDNKLSPQQSPQPSSGRPLSYPASWTVAASHRRCRRHPGSLERYMVPEYGGLEVPVKGWVVFGVHAVNIAQCSDFYY